MEDRDKCLLQIRPAVAVAPTENEPLAAFMHHTLRPVLKLQNHLLMDYFAQYVRERSQNFSQLGYAAQLDFVATTLRRDIGLKNTLIGAVIGVLTLPELAFYRAHRVPCNKRIIGMLTRRIQDQMHLI